MGDLASVRTGLQVRLDTIEGLRAYEHIADMVNPPAAVVGPAPREDFVVYDMTYGGQEELLMAVRLYVARADARGAQKELDPYVAASGAKSVKAAIEAEETLGGAADDTTVTRARDYGVFRVAGSDYIGCEFVVRVITS